VIPSGFTMNEREMQFIKQEEQRTVIKGGTINEVRDEQPKK
jgi:hypothetical protein